MKTVEKDELFSNLSNFLKAKGIELNPGSYSRRLRRGCDLLTDAVNVTSKTVSRAKAEVDRKLETLRQSIHSATAPQPPTSPATGQPPASTPATPKRATSKKSAPRNPPRARAAKRTRKKK